MPRSKKAVSDASPLSDEASPFPKVTKTDAVKAALDAGIDNPTAGAAYIKETFGIEVTNAQFSQSKFLVKKTGGKPAKAETNGKAHAAPVANGSVGVASSVEAIKGLVEQLGVDQVVSIARLFGK